MAMHIHLGIMVVTAEADLSSCDRDCVLQV